MSQTIFITGASSGIGQSCVQHFAEHGWNVVATMRNPDDGADLAERPNTLVTRLDLLDSDSIRSAVATAEAHFGGIDVLLNNAGYGAYGPLEATPIEVIRRQFDVNVFGLIETIQAVLPGMRKRRSGTIVNISSVGGRAAYPFGTPYHGSKWAVEGFTEALHFELVPFGIRTKIIEPGGVNTDFSGRSFVFTNDRDLEDYQPMVQARQNAGGTPTGKIEPAEVAEVVWTAVTDGTDQLRYLAGDGARTVLGQRYSAEQDEAFVAGMRAAFGL
jgi:NAD(P)-dependent dehydrogenase (short-subunit alcohol dehydrogenase family)